MKVVVEKVFEVRKDYANSPPFGDPLTPVLFASKESAARFIEREVLRYEKRGWVRVFRDALGSRIRNTIGLPSVREKNWMAQYITFVITAVPVRK